MSEPYDGREPDLDELTRDQLGEYDDRAAKVADVLDAWLLGAHGRVSTGHNVGLFLDLLAEQGYRVEPIEAPSFESLLPVVSPGEQP